MLGQAGTLERLPRDSLGYAALEILRDFPNIYRELNGEYFHRQMFGGRRAEEMFPQPLDVFSFQFFASKRGLGLRDPMGVLTALEREGYVERCPQLFESSPHFRLREEALPLL